jgi:ADP-heptose:LPS heptosyltransferase
MLAPGAAVHRPAKRWPAEHYALLARSLADRDITPVIIGAPNEADLGAIIRHICPRAIDLTGQTSLGELYAIAQGANVVIGNDTGPMHLAALSRTPCVILFGPDSDPAITAPRGPDGEWLLVIKSDNLQTLPAADVAARALAVARTP